MPGQNQKLRLRSRLQSIFSTESFIQSHPPYTQHSYILRSQRSFVKEAQCSTKMICANILNKFFIFLPLLS